MEVKEDISIKSLGTVGELKFQYESMRRGLQVSTPVCDNLKYDVVIGNDRGKVFRVQVKTSSDKDHDKVERYRFNTTGGSSRRVKYTPKDVDIFAFYIAPLDIFYFIPVHHIKAQTLRVHPFDKKHKFEIYREYWQIFS